MTEERHEKVLSSLLDLQARLRAEADAAGEPGDHSRVVKLRGSADEPASADPVSIIENDLEVSSEAPGDAQGLASVTPLPVAGSKEHVASSPSKLHGRELHLDPVMRLQEEIARRLDKDRDPAG
jgi:hypothetical protein